MSENGWVPFTNVHDLHSDQKLIFFSIGLIMDSPGVCLCVCLPPHLEDEDSDMCGWLAGGGGVDWPSSTASAAISGQVPLGPMWSPHTCAAVYMSAGCYHHTWGHADRFMIWWGMSGRLV